MNSAMSNIVTMEVNYDDPRWALCDCNGPRWSVAIPTVSPQLAKHFPIRGNGKALVPFEHFAMPGSTTPTQMLHEIKRRKLRLPDRAETECFLDAVQYQDFKCNMISLCGEISEAKPDKRPTHCRLCYQEWEKRRKQPPVREQWYMYQNYNGRMINRVSLGYRGFSEFRLLAVRE